MDKSSPIVNLSDGSKCRRIKDSNPDDFRNMADEQCKDDRSFNNWTQCMQYYGENDYLKDRARNYCTHTDRLWNDKCLSQNGNMLNNPGFLGKPLYDERVNFCKRNPGHSNCEGYVKDYDNYGNELLDYCKSNYDNVTNNTSCKLIFNIDSSKVETKLYNLTNPDMQNRIKNEKLKYCNDSNRFTNSTCINTVKGNPVYFGTTITKGCENSTSNDCKELNKYAEPALYQFKKKCIDSNNILVNSVDCLNYLVDDNNLNNPKFIDPVLNYCKLNANATNNPNCQNILKRYSTVSKSGFTDSVCVENKNNNYFQIFFIFIIFILFAVIVKKKCFNLENIYSSLYTFQNGC
jgi:gamma-glutamylcyclotransferase (GGCT)/AIG2-like uncharacterized protein YtfP